MLRRLNGRIRRLENNLTPISRNLYVIYLLRDETSEAARTRYLAENPQMQPGPLDVWIFIRYVGGREDET